MNVSAVSTSYYSLTSAASLASANNNDIKALQRQRANLERQLLIIQNSSDDENTKAQKTKLLQAQIQTLDSQISTKQAQGSQPANSTQQTTSSQQAATGSIQPTVNAQQTATTNTSNVTYTQQMAAYNINKIDHDSNSNATTKGNAIINSLYQRSGIVKAETANSYGTLDVYA